MEAWRSFRTLSITLFITLSITHLRRVDFALGRVPHELERTCEAWLEFFDGGVDKAVCLGVEG